MIHIALGSKNTVKIEAVRSAFTQMGYTFEMEEIEVSSEVSAQPFSDDETIEGAINRAKNALHTAGPGCDYGIGLEGGVTETPYGVFLCNWGAVVSRTGKVGIGGGHRLQLPEEIATQLRTGRELGDIIDKWAGGQNIRSKEGTIGVLTRNLISRKDMFSDVVICAFAPFLLEDDE